MLDRFSIMVFVLTVSCISCMTGSEVVIKNRSHSDKTIRVNYPADLKLPINNVSRTNDSLNTYDHTLTANAISTRDYYRYPGKTAIIMLDTVNRTYSFNLKSGHDVIIESRWTEPSSGIPSCRRTRQCGGPERSWSRRAARRGTGPCRRGR